MILKTYHLELAVFATALILSVSVVFGVFSVLKHQGRDPVTELVFSTKDSKEYLSLAQGLRETQTFTRFEANDPKPELFRVPVYPLFLTLVQRISASPLSIPLAQAVLFSLSCLLIYSIGKNIGSTKIGLAAALGYLAIPATHHLYLLALSETLFQSTFLLWLYLLLRWVNQTSPSVVRSLILGGMSGSLALLRPAALFLLPYTFGLIFFWHAVTRTKPNRKQSLVWIKGVLVVSAAFCLVTGSWVLRNRQQANFSGISTISSYNLFYYNFADFTAVRFGLTRSEALDRQLAEVGLTQETADKNDPAVIARLDTFNSRYVRRLGVDYTLFHLKKTALFFIQSDAKSFFAFIHTHVLQRGAYTDPSLIDFFTSHRWSELGIAVFRNPREVLFLFERFAWALFLAGSALSLLIVPRDRRRTMWLLFGIALYFALITGPVLMARYRLPAAPSLLLLSCVAIQELAHRRGKKTISDEDPAR